MKFALEPSAPTSIPAAFMVAQQKNPLIKPRYMLGHEIIDFDHIAIAKGWFRAVHCEVIQFPFFVARLKKLMRGHFDHEAELMGLAGGSLCCCHRREHQALLEFCDEAAALNERNPRKAATLLRSQFPKLFRNHIIESDSLAVLFIHSNGGARCAC